MRVAFGCEARVGKDSVCAMLQQKHGGTTFSFAQPIYDIMHYAQNVTGRLREKDTLFLQIVGTEWGRARDPDVWVKATQSRILQCTDTNIFVSDIRFPNEFDMLKSLGFVCIRIIRPNRPIDRNTLHESEQAAIGLQWDHQIVNDGTLEDLYAQVELILSNQ